MPMKGLENLSKMTRELERVASALDGDLPSVNFDPKDPQSIEIAIKEMENNIDERAGSYSQSNDIVRNMIESFKEQGRQAILERAQSARVQSQSNE